MLEFLQYLSDSIGESLLDKNPHPLYCKRTFVSYNDLAFTKGTRARSETQTFKVCQVRPEADKTNLHL
jgi:hypothetical protein